MASIIRKICCCSLVASLGQQGTPSSLVETIFYFKQQFKAPRSYPNWQQSCGGREKLLTHIDAFARRCAWELFRKKFKMFLYPCVTHQNFRLEELYSSIYKQIQHNVMLAKGLAGILMTGSVFVKTGSVLNMNKKEHMEFLVVFCLFWECITRVHSWLAKPLQQLAFYKGK